MAVSFTWSSLGRVFLGIAVAAFGVEDLVHGDFLPELQRAPAWLPARAALASLTGAVLVSAGVCLIANRVVRSAACVIAAIFGLTVLAFYAPVLIATPRDGGAWTIALEVVAITGAALQLGLPTRPAVGGTLFALTLPGFGVLHFIYVDYVAFVIPAWIPAHRFFAYATGVAHAAGGVALLSGVQARLAAQLVAAMFGLWVVLLHLPRALAAAGTRGEWTSLFVALAMCAAGLHLIDTRRS